MKTLFNFIGLIGWISGIIIAKGFWSTAFAFFIPFWSWYLTVEKLMTNYGII